MNTPAHMLLGLAVCGRPGKRARNTAVLSGALLPDATIMAMVAWQGWVAGRTGAQIFGIDYFSPFWQEVFAVSNSVPVFLACGIFGVLTRHRWVTAFAAAALLHVLADLPLHAGDGHPPWWPFSDWTYVSPFSYWDVRYGARIVAPLEFLVTAAVAAWLWTRYRSTAFRVGIAGCVIVEAFFVFAADILYGG